MPDLHENYDWRDAGTWRALIVLAVLSGSFIAIAALASEVLVRDVLGLQLGSGGYGPDIAAGILALLLVLKMVWRRVGASGLSKIGWQPRASGHRRDGRGASSLSRFGIVAVWMGLTLASYFLLFYSVLIAFDLEGPGRLTSLVAVLAPLMLGQIVLFAELERLGARHAPNPPPAS